MTATWPQVGDPAVDFRRGRRSYERDRAGKDVTVSRLTQTMVITSDGERYNRGTLKPVSEGHYSDRELVPAYDPRVLAVRARDELAEVARQITNLAAIEHKTAEDVVGALAQAMGAANDGRRSVLALMREASAMEQEASR